jgi:predicted ABC-type ATPase
VPELIIIAGPNGAGKTSFANKYFDTPRPGFVYLNADELARDLAAAGIPQGQLNVRAGREMLGRIDTLVAARTSFMFETTLASLSYALKIPAWRRSGYRVALIYLRLPNEEMSVERVLRRVAQGGHGVPENVIRQRFAKSADYFERRYKSIVDEWYVWDSLENEFRRAEAWND